MPRQRRRNPELEVRVPVVGRARDRVAEACVLAIHLVGGTEIEGDAVLDDLILFENLVEDFQGRPASHM